MVIHNVEQGTDEWLALRLGKLTGSKAQAIAAKGKGLNTLCQELAWEKVTGVREETFKNENMQNGNDKEQYAADAYELTFGVDLQKVGFAEWSDYVGCSPDRLVGSNGGLEIKSRTLKKHRDLLLGNDTFETGWIWQCHMCLLIFDRDWWDITSYNENFGKSCLFVDRIVRDKLKDEQLLEGFDMGTKLIKEYEEKYHNMLGY